MRGDPRAIPAGPARSRTPSFPPWRSAGRPLHGRGGDLPSSRRARRYPTFGGDPRSSAGPRSNGRRSRAAVIATAAFAQVYLDVRRRLIEDRTRAASSAGPFIDKEMVGDDVTTSARSSVCLDKLIGAKPADAKVHALVYMFLTLIAICDVMSSVRDRRFEIGVRLIRIELGHRRGWR